jgi:hypothetical protein
MLTQDELDIKGAELARLADNVGVSSLNDEEAKTLFYYETWKDGADWKTIVEYQTDPFWDDQAAIRDQLTRIFCHKP